MDVPFRVGRLTRVAFCGLLAAAALPSTTYAVGEPIVGVPSSVPAPALPAPVEVPQVQVQVQVPQVTTSAPTTEPAASAGVSASTPVGKVSAKVSASKSGVSASAAVTKSSRASATRASRAAAAARRAKAVARARVAAELPERVKHTAGAAGEFLVTTSQRIPVPPAIQNPCTADTVAWQGFVHIVEDTETGKTYTTVHAEGVGTVVPVKYVADTVTHEHAFGETMYHYTRILRQGESGPTTGVSGGGDDWFLRFEIPVSLSPTGALEILGVQARAECK